MVLYILTSELQNSWFRKSVFETRIIRVYSHWEVFWKVSVLKFGWNFIFGLQRYITVIFKNSLFLGAPTLVVSVQTLISLIAVYMQTTPLATPERLTDIRGGVFWKTTVKFKDIKKYLRYILLKYCKGKCFFLVRYWYTTCLLAFIVVTTFPTSVVDYYHTNHNISP